MRSEMDRMAGLITVVTLIAIVAIWIATGGPR